LPPAAMSGCASTADNHSEARRQRKPVEILCPWRFLDGESRTNHQATSGHRVHPRPTWRKGRSRPACRTCPSSPHAEIRTRNARRDHRTPAGQVSTILLAEELEHPIRDLDYSLTLRNV